MENKVWGLDIGCGQLIAVGAYCRKTTLGVAKALSLSGEDGHGVHASVEYHFHIVPDGFQMACFYS